MAERAQLALISTVEHFRLVACHVNTCRAVRRARLTRQAQIERLSHFGSVPVGKKLSARQFFEDAHTPTGHVFLVTGHVIRRAQVEALAEPVSATIAHTRTAVNSAGHVPVIVSEVEAASIFSRPCVGAAQIRIDSIRTDEHPWVENIVRIKKRLDLGKCVNDFLRIHTRKQLAAAAAVTVLTGKRTAIGGDQIGGALHETAIFRQTSLVVKGKIDTDMDAPVAEMPVHQTVQAELVEQGAQIAQIVAKALGGHGGIFPARPRLGVGGSAPAKASAIRADTPQLGRVRTCFADTNRISIGCGGKLFGTFKDIGSALALARPNLNKEPASTLGQSRNRALVAAHGLHHFVIHALDGEGLKSRHCHDVICRAWHIGIAEDDERGRSRHGHEAHDRFKSDGESALGADKEFGEIPPIFRQEMFKGIAGDLAFERTHVRADCREMAICQLGKTLNLLTALTCGDSAPVGKQCSQFDDVIRGAAIRQGVCTAGVVANRAAERGTILRRGVRTEAQAVLCRFFLQVTQNDTGLNARCARLRVNLDDFVHVARKVEDNTCTNRIAGS